MRKLAPMFVMTSIVALAGGNAFANMDKTTTTTSATTGSAASPTVSPNTNNPQGQSYSDKGSSEPGTNAIMDDKSKPSMASTTDDDKNLKKTKKTVKKAKLAQHTEAPVKSDATKADASVSASSTTSTNPPTKTTDSAAANSATGRSAGQ